MKEIHLPRWNELPKIELYVDQVVNLLEQWLSFLPEDRLITKSMINNYVKNGLVEAPKKKKYTTTHLAYLIIVCLFKQVYTMNEITSMIRLQVHAYPTDQAYDYFIEDFEMCMNNALRNLPFSHPQPETNKPLTKLLQSVTESLVSKFIVQIRLKEEISKKREEK